MQIRYNYSFDRITNTFNFITKNSIIYRVAFIVDETFSTIYGADIPNVYQIIIDKATEGTEPLDIRVSRTIDSIIDKFFEKIENSLIYICSDLDNKAELRHKIFDRWYINSVHKDKVIKIDNILNIKISENEYHKLFTSFMFHKNNSNCEKLMNIYKKIEATLNNK